MYKSSYTEVDSSGMRNPVMYDIDKDGKADILGSITTGWPGYGYKDYLIIFGQDFVTNNEPGNELVIKQDYLSQNYPNPFNASTKIKFDISSQLTFPHVFSGNPEVKLIIYNILGREIQTLVNEKLNPGTYEVTFDGINISSGIYFYTLSVNGLIKDTKKLLLIK
jgi:hypothetical protein